MLIIIIYSILHKTHIIKYNKFAKHCKTRTAKIVIRQKLKKCVVKRQYYLEIGDCFYNFSAIRYMLFTNSRLHYLLSQKYIYLMLALKNVFLDEMRKWFFRLQSSGQCILKSAISHSYQIRLSSYLLNSN